MNKHGLKGIVLTKVKEELDRQAIISFCSNLIMFNLTGFNWWDSKLHEATLGVIASFSSTLVDTHSFTKPSTPTMMIFKTCSLTFEAAKTDYG